MLKTFLIISITIITKSIKTETIIDLSHSFDNNTNYWKTSQPFTFTKKTTTTFKNGFWYSSNEFCVGEHSGTHLDAPYHFNEDGPKVGEIPTSHLFAKGILIDLINITNQIGPSTLLLPEHLEQWQTQNGVIENGTVLLVRFGWAKNWSNRTKYFGIINGDESVYHFPGISESAAQWIADSKNFYGVGVDTASVDAGSSQDFIAHRILSKSLLYNLENVNIPETLPANGFSLIVAPMNILEGTGAPVRIFAVKEPIRKNSNHRNI